jgi:hypothetical protein
MLDFSILQREQLLLQVKQEKMLLLLERWRQLSEQLLYFHVLEYS